jgi:predicted nucleic acid-binding protein
MKRVFVDANVFLRFFTVDQEGHHDLAVRLFDRAAAGEVRLVTGPPVLFEVAWTLRSSYGLSRDQVLDVLVSVLAARNLELTDKALVADAVQRARAAGVEFADAYIAASAAAHEAQEIATFNTSDFRKLKAKLHAMSG